MNQSQGETAVTTSALICTGLYAYRKTTEKITGAPTLSKNGGAPLAKGLKPSVEGVLGVGELLPLGQWATGMALTFIGLSIATSVNPKFGGSFAVLVAVGAILGNGNAALSDVKHGLTGAPVKANKATSSTTSPPQPIEGRQAGSFSPQAIEGGNLKPQSLNQPPVG
jgi:hypothetical protein